MDSTTCITCGGWLAPHRRCEACGELVCDSLSCCVYTEHGAWCVACMTEATERRTRVAELEHEIADLEEAIASAEIRLAEAETELDALLEKREVVWTPPQSGLPLLEAI